MIVGGLGDVVAQVLAAIVLVGGAASVIYVWGPRLWRRIRPPAPPAPRAPKIVFDGPYRGIENAEPDMTVTKVMVRGRSRSGVALPEFQIAALSPQRGRVELPGEFEGASALSAQFTDPDERRWEVAYDPSARRHTYRRVFF